MVKDRLRPIRCLGEPVRTITTGRRKEMPPQDSAKAQKPENVRFAKKFVISLVNWNLKRRQRSGPGTGRMRYMKTLSRRFKNGFRSGTTPKKRVKQT